LTTIAPAIKGWIQDFVSSNIRFELGCHGTPFAGPVAKTASFRFPLKDDASKHRGLGSPPVRSLENFQTRHSTGGKE
jgi:hypothetical protein